MWNYSTTETARSNNHVESFHGRLNKVASSSHPNIFKVIFRNIEGFAINTYNKLRNGEIVSKRDKKEI